MNKKSSRSDEQSFSLTSWSIRVLLRNRTRSFLLLSSGIGILIALPILKTPLGTDDIWMSTLRGYNIYHHTSGTQYFSDKAIEFSHIGRLAELTNLLQWLTSYFIYHRVIYKIFLVVLNLCVALQIQKTLRQVDRDHSSLYPNMAFIMFLALGEIRSYYDPRTQISGVCELTLVCIFVGISQFWKLQNQFSKARLAIFTLLLIVSMYIYEMSFFILGPLLILFLYKIYRNRMNINPKEKVWYYACFSILFVQYIVFFLIHFLARGLQPDSQLRLNASRFFKTFSLQFFGSFPSTHFANQDVFQTRYLSRLTLIIFLVLASSSIILIFFSYSPPKTKARNGIRSSQSETQLTTDLLVIGISLFIIPTCVTAMTLRFQDEVQIGLPYSSFYYEQVGFTVLFFLFIRKVTGKRKNFLVLVISITIIYSSCWISLVVNNTVTSADFPLTQNLAISQNILGWQREAVERAAKYGALNSLGKSAEIDFVPQYSWTTTEYLSFFAGRKIRVLNSPHWWQNTNIIPKGQCTNPECSQMYYANVVATSYDSGIIALSKFSDILLRDGLMESQKWELIISTKTFVDEVSICEVVNSAKMNEAPVNHRFVIFTGKLPHSGVLTVPYRSQKPILSTSFSIC